MGKQERHIKHTAVQNKGAIGSQIEQTEIYNDNLLPDVSEIKGLMEVDPDIMKWLKDRAEKEQNFRHNAYFDKMKLLSKSESGARLINYLGLSFAFILLLCCLIIGGFLVYNKNIVVGTVFSGCGLLSVVALFITRVKPK
jgi:uncharacterized membrane protein